jgi:hypothetical protein
MGSEAITDTHINQRVLVRFVPAPAKTMAAGDWPNSVIEGLCQRDWPVLDKNLVTKVTGLISACRNHGFWLD